MTEKRSAAEALYRDLVASGLPEAQAAAIIRHGVPVHRALQRLASHYVAPAMDLLNQVTDAGFPLHADATPSPREATAATASPTRHGAPSR